MTFVKVLFVLSCFWHKIRAQECGCNTIPSVRIIDDDNLAKGLKEVRDNFLQLQASTSFNRLSATILLRQGSQSSTWRRGSVNGTRVDYPASTVKLMYMFAAMEWCKEQGLSVDCLDRYVRPMIVVSSNLDTGYVIDAITNTTNIDDLTSTNDTRWPQWYDARLSVERLLQRLNLYDNQVIRSKTYPTNSGQSPIGSESVLIRAPLTGNRLQSCCSASFMLYLMQTRAQEELNYMKSMLYRTLESDQSTFANGLPAGTILHSKVGNAYDTVEEIAYIELPNGHELILSAFSNGYQRGEGDFYILGRFVELVLEKFSLNSSTSTMIFTSDHLTLINCTGEITRHTRNLPRDTIGNSLFTFNDSCRIRPLLTQRGVYTVSLWNPSMNSSSNDNRSRLSIAVTDVYNVTDSDGFEYDQYQAFSSWKSVGDFLLGPGEQEVHLKSIDKQSTFNAIRFSLHPTLNIPTVSC